MPPHDDRSPREVSLPPTRRVGDEPAAAGPGPTAVTRVGQRFGRFEILDVLGAGGMGTVFEARDLTLDRAVALKLLHPDAVARAERRVLREAKALAKLSHPNVVQVFEAGTIDERPFIAMELVRGQTLAEWQAARHDWREIVGVYLQAGRGLAAAHAECLVHRDFKPSNCILDAQGRVRVLDFGLARAIDAAVVTEALASRANVDAFPSTGGRMDLRPEHRGAPGTLGYMPLEQLWGQPLDAKSDQFSFCVSLFEALCGRRPFAGESVDGLVFAMLDGALDWPPAATKLPRSLRQLLERGLRARPEARWSSMDDVLRELERIMRVRSRRRQAVVLGVGVSLAVAAGGSALWWSRAPTCDDGSHGLDDAWGPEHREHVAAAIASARVDLSPDLVARLDAYAQRWREISTATCEAEHRELVDATTAATRQRCLTEAHAALADLAELLGEGKDVQLGYATRWIAELPELALCEQTERFASRWPLPADPALVAQVRPLRRRRAMAEASYAAGERAAALAALDAVHSAATTLGYEPLLAEIEVVRGSLWIEGGRFDDAERELERAYARAVEHNHPYMALRAANSLTYVVGDLRERHDVGFKWGLTAEALARQPWSDPHALASTKEMLGHLLYEQGHFAEAEQHFRAAFEVHEPLEPDGAMLPLIESNIALMLIEQGRYEEALPLVHTVLERRRAEQSPEDPVLAFPLVLLGISLHELGRHDEALAHYGEALNIRVGSLGFAHPSVVTLLGQLGTLWLDMGDPSRALRAHQQALTLGTATLDPTHSHTAEAWLGIARVLRVHGQLDAAARHAARGAKMLEQTVGPRHRNVGLAKLTLGQIDHARGERAAAREHLEEAADILAVAEGPPAALASARFSLAQVLWASPTERDAARVLAEQALGAYAIAGELSREEAAEVKAWLAAREPG